MQNSGLGGHGGYETTVRSAKAVLPIAVEMEELFPQVDHFITEFGMGRGPRLWNTVAYFGGRYELHMSVEVDIDYRQRRIIRAIGSPEFVLWECERIWILPDGRAQCSYKGSNERHFGAREWQKLFQSGGDVSAVGVVPSSTGVDNFDEYVAQWRRGMEHISLLGK